MAVKYSIGTGNFLTAGTWGVVDATSYLNAENATESLLTTAYSGTRSTAFTPGVITVSHIGVKLCERIGTTGTISVSLRNSTLGLDDFVTGTEVTCDTADLPSALETDTNGGWIFFKLASPVLLLAANDYNVQAKTSSATMVDLWCDATVDNISRALVTTTTGAPAAGDDLIIAGEYVDASTFNTFTVTMNETATTDYGAASTSLVTPSLAICNGGTLTWGTTAATNYYLRQSGNVIIYSGGTMNMGTTGTPCPRDSTQKLNFDCGANVDFGLTVRNLGTYVAQGLSRTAAKLIVSCKLNTDEAAAQTTLGVDTDTGWLSGDTIAIASTTRTASECESRILDGNAGASSMVVTVGLTNAHSGTSPTQAEVILLTRNVSVFGASASLQSYVDIKATATIDIDWTEFYWMGSATSLKRGINCEVTTGSVNIQYSSLHNFEVTSSLGFSWSTGTGTSTFSNNVTYLIANIHYSPFNSGACIAIADNNIFMRNTDSAAAAPLVMLQAALFNFTNNTTVGSTNSGIGFNGSNIVATTFSGNVSHSNNSNGMILDASSSWSMANQNWGSFTSWRNNSNGFVTAPNCIVVDCTLTDWVFFGNVTTNINLANSSGVIIHNLKFINLISNGDSTFSTTNGVAVPTNTESSIIFYNANFSTASGIKTAHTNDFAISTFSSVQIILNSCILAASTEVASQASIGSSASFISSQKHDQTAGLHKTWKKYGTITIDTTAGMFRTASPSERLTPNNASGKLDSGHKFIAVANGATLTPSVYVRESVAGDGTDYNGARPRLILKRNDAIGITADTVIDTATASAEGAFEQLAGTTAAATDDGVMEFYVDGDGTTGWVNCDDWSVT